MRMAYLQSRSEFDGKPYVLEYAIHVDYALLRGYRADRLGNVITPAEM